MCVHKNMSLLRIYRKRFNKRKVTKGLQLLFKAYKYIFKSEFTKDVS